MIRSERDGCPAGGGLITMAVADSLVVLVGLPTSDAVTMTVSGRLEPAGGATPSKKQGTENSPGCMIVPTTLPHTALVTPLVVSVMLSILTGTSLELRR